MVFVSLANKVFQKLETIPMYNYPNFLSLFTTFVCEYRHHVVPVASHGNVHQFNSAFQVAVRVSLSLVVICFLLPDVGVRCVLRSHPAEVSCDSCGSTSHYILYFDSVGRLIPAF